MILEKNKKFKDKDRLVKDVRRIVRSSTGNRAKESFIVDFIHKTELDKIEGKTGIFEGFFEFAQEEQKKEVDELI